MTYGNVGASDSTFIPIQKIFKNHDVSDDILLYLTITRVRIKQN